MPLWLEVLRAPTTFKLKDGLGRGETEAISLARSLRADAILLDDFDARCAARQCGLHVVGAVGILISAKQQGLLSSIRADLDFLRAGSFHVSRGLYEQALRAVGEI